MMIPKIIHYCWFGRNPLPELAQKCIASWKKFFPDYEIKEWNEDNFDVNIIPYTKEAYSAGKYAFVSDYARFWILYKYGGLYFDTDVEVIRPMTDIIARGPFMGCENEAEGGSTPPRQLGVAPGLGLGCIPGLDIYQIFLDMYSTLHFVASDETLNTKSVVEYVTEILVAHGLKNTSEIQHIAGVYIYPKEYFCPKDYHTEKIELTANSVAIHHYVGSWLAPEERLEHNLRLIFYRLGIKPTGNWSRIIWYLSRKFSHIY